MPTPTGNPPELSGTKELGQVTTPARVESPISRPLVSIGLPTYNGAAHLRRSLDCLVSQDYGNLELLVSDNASTDGTPEIAAEFARRDARVRVVRQPQNIGPTANFMYVLRQTRGEYFMWAADDDQWEHDFVSACLGALEANPAAVMAATSVRFVEGDGTEAAPDYVPALFDNPDLSSPDPARRIGRLMSRAGWYLIYGLIRRHALDTLRPIAPGYGSDVVLTAELAARGPIVVIPRQLFTYTVVRQSVDPDRGAWNQDVIGFTEVRQTPYSHLQEACCAAVASAGLGWWQHQRAHAALLAACYFRPTPIRTRIEAEVQTRLRLARARRDISDLLKYGVLEIWLRLRRRFGR